MNDSADIRTAADKFQSALRHLEGELGPLLDKVSRLEVAAKSTESFETDRANLAQQLDEATSQVKTQAQDFEARETEFATLAEQTTRELDSAIRQIKSILSEG